MALTKLDYLRLAESVEAMYMNCSTQLIINIARHLGTGKGLSTAEWQIKKLSEMQSLTAESMEIIAANTGKRHEAVERVFREILGIGVADTEKVLQAAVKAGKLSPVPSIEDSDAMRNLLQAYIAQADDTLNMVNTVMLQHTLDQYRYNVNQITVKAQQEAAEIAKRLGASDEQGVINSLAYTQNVLNTDTTNVVTGAISRQKALRDACKELASRGITGFVDAGGHHWSAEAYVNMDIRTTAHNVAIEAQRERSAEYGVSTFQISTHAGARPLCAPYQGWICSWDNTGGTVTDLYGKEYQVHPINSTSYGEAAGIFGINCGHFPETFVDGFSIPRYHELTPEEEARNKIEYAQSQQQRELEREIREAKTNAASLAAANDPEAFKKAAAKVKEKQNDYKQFCEQTGRTPRPDRTQVTSYNRSVSGRVTWSNRKNPTPPKPPKNVNPKLTLPQKQDDIFKNVKGLTDDFKKGMAETLDKCQFQEAKDLYKKFADELVCVDGNLKRGAYFSSFGGGVYMNLDTVAKGNHYEFPYEVAFHEFGHMSDWLAGGKNSMKYLSNTPIEGKQLLDVIKSDFKEFKKTLGVSKAADVIQTLAAEGMDKRTCGNISDILEKCTNTSYPLGIGHGKNYHKRDGATEKEFFAEVLDSAVTNEASYNQMRRLFPNAVDLVWKMIRGIL